MIREIRNEDKTQVVNLLKTLYGREEEFISRMVDSDILGRVKYFVYCEDGHVLGMISFLSDGNICRVKSHVVAERYRGNGIGKDLLKCFESEADSYRCKAAEITTWEEKYFDFLMRNGYRPAFFQVGFVVLRKQLT